jgi:hypothetical protein
VADARTTAWSAGAVPAVKLTVVERLIPTRSGDRAEAWMGNATAVARAALARARSDGGTTGEMAYKYNREAPGRGHKDDVLDARKLE